MRPTRLRRPRNPTAQIGNDMVTSARGRHRGNLDGLRVLLTGASSGIGRSLAGQLADQGAILALAARREELLHDLADEIRDVGHPRPTVLVSDLSVTGAAAELGRRSIAALGGVDIVINNAGASLVGSQPSVADCRSAREVFEVNLWSPLALTAAVLPGMLAARAGTIVNVTSTVQAVPLPLLGYYSASKAALAQSTRALRHELAGTSVKVLEVVPGSTDTALRDVDELPWKTTPPRTFTPVSPDAVARAVVRELKRGRARVVYPRYSLLPLELPAIGRLVAVIGGRRVDTRAALLRSATS